jgi:PAS domain S-box-containing protein
VPAWLSLTNRSLGLIVLWTITSLLLKYKKTEGALKTSERQFRELAENIREVFRLTDPVKDRTLYVSPAYETIWGRTCASLYASPRSWLEAVHPQDRARVLNTVETERSRGDYHETYRIHRTDGSVRWIRDRAFPILDQGGAVCRIAGLAEDITERKMAERRQTAQYAVTRILAESASMAETIPKILQVLSENLEWEMGAFWTVDQEANVLRCDTVWWVPEKGLPAFETVSRQMTLSRGIGVPGRVWASGEAAWIPDLFRDANFRRAAVAAEGPLRSALAFPVRWENQILGVFEFFSRTPRLPDEDLLHLLGSVGSQIGQFTTRKRAEEEREKLVRKLQDALARIKTLRGLVPICSSCQKVRDDRGSWKDLPTYVRSHSEADFRLDLCPDCGMLMFPEFYRGQNQRLH